MRLHTDRNGPRPVSLGDGNNGRSNMESVEEDAQFQRSAGESELICEVTAQQPGGR